MADLQKTSTGTVVIIDGRIITKSYSTKFLAAIPKCKIEIVATETWQSTYLCYPAHKLICTHWTNGHFVLVYFHGSS